MRILNGVPMPLPDDHTRVVAGLVIGPNGAPDDKFVMIVMGREHLVAAHAVIESALEVMATPFTRSMMRKMSAEDRETTESLKVRLHALHNALTAVGKGWDTDGDNATYQLDGTADVFDVPTTTPMPRMRPEDIN